MNNLICAEFSRLFKSFIFRLAALFSFGFAVFAIFMRYMDVINYPSEYAQLPVSYSNADGLIFAGGFYLVFAFPYLSASLWERNTVTERCAIN